jgi:hypothetical protein
LDNILLLIIAFITSFDKREEYLTFTTEESEKLEVQNKTEELDGNIELAIKQLAESKRQKQ